MFATRTRNFIDMLLTGTHSAASRHYAEAAEQNLLLYKT